MFLVSNGRGRSQEEGACDHRCNEGEAEEEERMSCKARSVTGCYCVGIRGGTKFLILEDPHAGRKVCNGCVF